MPAITRQARKAKKLGIRSILTKPVTRFTLQKALAKSIGTDKEPAQSEPKRKIAEPA
ncbi:hypothetical protein [Endozoicomonas montiporae]|uniref:hypothetical protein n=1 Tax=Endozoicomonas montiporae TaxID=1027273 RepID=UPI000AC0C541|nr:hypothetical protein [Endozoicomonas montiporae]